MAKNIKKLEELFKTFATPEEKLEYELKKIKDKITELESRKPLKGDKGDSIKGDPGKSIKGEPGKDGSPDTGEQIVEKINELEIQTEKQIDFLHIKNFPFHLIKSGKNDLIAWGNSDVSLFEINLASKTGYNSYMEYTEVGGNITQVNYWSDSSKATKLFTKDITYSGTNPTIVVTTDELSRKVLTTTITYSGTDISSITKVLS